MCDRPASRRSALKMSLAAGGALLAGSTLTAAPAQAATGDRLVMLGVDGGPKVNAGRAKPALALVTGGRTYLVDCGLDTTRQLVAAGLTFASVRNLFVTHHHLDHTSGLPDLVLHGWTNAPTALSDLGLWGPPGMSRKVAGLKTLFGQDVELFETGGGFPEFPRLRARDVSVGARITHVMEDEHVVVDATRVFHGPEVKNAYAYRFTLKRSGKRVVFSGDTAAPDPNLIELARGCDVLVHEVQDNDQVDAIANTLPPDQGEALRRHLLEAHSNVTDVPAVAKAAGVRTLVFCHYTPVPQPASVYLGKAKAAADAIGYRGTIIAPGDLDVIPL
ncbi:MBL fold metallo-hydrolase [Amycolatopsis thermalba]|uniref:MBL fold metallo-hydrolase n=1 Tax=Amycolatopsis thermalba TaxID=944492 RepID=A0ABY4NU87_9PSEU|nr:MULTISPECIES: MBL fold metallo-hydrolase [Amycolatopsis]UQS23568.1 MBL fold metallo-hydrolase [Amycolatopsis thermalba]